MQNYGMMCSPIWAYTGDPGRSLSLTPQPESKVREVFTPPPKAAASFTYPPTPPPTATWAGINTWVNNTDLYASLRQVEPATMQQVRSDSPAFSPIIIRSIPMEQTVHTPPNLHEEELSFLVTSSQKRRLSAGSENSTGSVSSTGSVGSTTSENSTGSGGSSGSGSSSASENSTESGISSGKKACKLGCERKRGNLKFIMDGCCDSIDVKVTCKCCGDDVPFTLLASPSSSASPTSSPKSESEALLKNVRPRTIPVATSQLGFCRFCQVNGESSEVYRSHTLRSDVGKVTCPTLREYNCPICNNGGGDYAHTIKYCPLARGRAGKTPNA